MSFIKNSSLELGGTDLALHSSPHVGGHCVVILSHYFIFKPAFEANKVHEHGAVAWVKLHVLNLIIGNVVHVTILADFLLLLTMQLMRGGSKRCWLMLEIIFNVLKLIALRLWLSWFSPELNDFIFNSSKSYYVILLQ